MTNDPENDKEVSLVANFPIQGVKLNCNPMLESAKNGVRPKDATFNVLPLTYNG